MSRAAESAELRAPLFRCEWDFDLFPIAFPGADFDPPGKTGVADAPSTWAEFFVDYDDVAEFAFAGPTARKTEGTILFSVMQEPAADDYHARRLVDMLLDPYRDADTPTLIFHPARVEVIEIGEDSGWWRIDAELPFTRFDG